MANPSQDCLSQHQRDIYTVPTYNPSDYYRSHTPQTNHPNIAPSRPEDLYHRNNVQDEGIKAILANQSLPTRRSAASILLDRFLSSQSSPRQQSFSAYGEALTHSHSLVPQQTQNATSGWEHVPFPRGTENAFGPNHLPPPPSGPPPANDHTLNRVHSVVREIAVPPTNQVQNATQLNSYALPTFFRQNARADAPLPLTSRELVNAAPKIPAYAYASRSELDALPAPPTMKPPGRHRKPTAINVRLAERITLDQEHQPARSAPFSFQALDTSHKTRAPPAARYFDQIYPQTAGLPQIRTTLNTHRRLSLSPIDTLSTPDSRHSLMVDFALSPSLIPFASTTLSPVSNRRSTQSPSSGSWSPQTPRAMTFNTGSNAIHNSSEGHSDGRRETMIEEEIQDATPLETKLPRGRILAKHDFRAAHDQRQARSMSPPTSAYPKDSAFSWDQLDADVRFATDDDLYCLTPTEIPQMIEERLGKEMDATFDPRQTILGSYFGR